MLKYLVFCAILLGVAYSQTTTTPYCSDSLYDLYYSQQGQLEPRCLRLMVLNQTWTNHRSLCQANSGDLLTQTTRYLQLQFSTLLQIDAYDDANYFIGGSDAASEGLWRWVTDNTIFSSDTIWSSNEPDGGTDQNCACFCRPNFYMCSCECELLRYGICEIDVSFIISDDNQ